MRRIPLTILAATLALGTVAAHDGDLAEHPCYDADTDALAYPEQQVWFAEGDTKVGNTSETPHGWTTEAPGSVTTGAGAGHVSASSQADNGATTAVFEGTFTGCIGTVLFDLYSFDPANRTSTTAGPTVARNHTVVAELQVDGVPVWSGQVETTTTHRNEGMGPNRNTFSLDLADTMVEFAAFLPPLDGEHTVTLSVNPYFINTGSAVVYTWGADESPSGLTFNGAITEDHPKAN